MKTVAAAAKVHMSALHHRSRKVAQPNTHCVHKYYSNVGCFPASAAPFIGNLTYCQLNVIISGVFAALTCILMLILFGLHITHLSKLNEQYMQAIPTLFQNIQN
jgi:hypothetical protein